MSITDSPRQRPRRLLRTYATLAPLAAGATLASAPATAASATGTTASATGTTDRAPGSTTRPEPESATPTGTRRRPVGSVVAVQRLNPALWVPGAARGFRVDYVSNGHDGRERVVGGAVFVPPGTPPKGGWPVVTWAHGTVGVADPCVPSTTPRSERDTSYLRRWLAAGYGVVATDCAGLGKPGDHPYLHGRSAAYNVIDMVRAARAADASLSRRWFAVGQSQGAQAVLYAASMATTYGAGLDLRGVVATAPPTQWGMTFATIKPFRPGAHAARPVTPPERKSPSCPPSHS